MTNKPLIKPILPFSIAPSNIEQVDAALFNWLNNLNLSAKTNRGWKKIDVIWVGAERVYQNKRKSSKGILTLPLITIEGTSITKDLSKWGAFSAIGNMYNALDKRGGSIPVYMEIKQDKSANFTNAETKRTHKLKSDKVVYKVAYLPAPIYLNFTYNITIRTEYRQQMSDLILPFASLGDRTNYFVIRHDGHSYECFVQGNFNLDNNGKNMGEEARDFKVSFEINVLGKVHGSGNNQDTPDLTFYETATDFKWQSDEQIIRDEE